MRPVRISVIAVPTSSGTISNRSTSTSPRSVIFSDGITESARKASVRNGVAPVQPRPWAASFVARLCSITVGERRVREQAGDGQRALRDDAAVVDDDDAAADLGEVADGERQVVVAHADDDEVVGVVRDRGGERAVRQARAGDEAEPDPAGREVALDDGDLGEARVGVGDRVAVDDDRLPLERLRHDLVLDQPDRADRGAVRGDLEVGGRDRLHPHGLAHPLGHRRRRHVLDRAAALEHEVGREALEVGQQEQVGLVARRDRAEVVEPVPLGGVERRHHDRVLRRDPERDRLAHHPVDVAVLGDVLGIAVVGAEGDPARAVLDARAGGAP